MNSGREPLRTVLITRQHRCFVLAIGCPATGGNIISLKVTIILNGTLGVFPASAGYSYYAGPSLHTELAHLLAKENRQ